MRGVVAFFLHVICLVESVDSGSTIADLNDKKVWEAEVDQVGTNIRPARISVLFQFTLLPVCPLPHRPFLYRFAFYSSSFSSFFSEDSSYEG